MEKELEMFASENDLSPFNKLRTSLRTPTNSIFKTKDAKLIHSKVLSSVSGKFVFSDTANLLLKSSFTNDADEIKRRQEFIKNIPDSLSNNFLKGLKLEKRAWKPPYGIIVVTEDDKTFNELQKIGVPVKFLISETDMLELENADIVQVIDCNQFTFALERLPQTVFLKSIDEAYLERHVELLGCWKDAIKILENNSLDSKTKDIVNWVLELLPLLNKKSSERITKEQVEEALDEIKKEIGEKVKKMSVSGSSLIDVLSRGVIPEELRAVVNEAISRTGLPDELFLKTIPVGIDESELEKVLRKQSLTEFTSIAERIKLKSNELIKLPEKLRELEIRLLLYDFKAGISQWKNGKCYYPETGENLLIDESENLFLEKPQPITFYLSPNERCSILTGANSGGKTTLVEHILQAISCMQLGLPFSGRVVFPMFTEVYYFAKTKGSMSKGAFETLLTQMSEINPGSKTLILADEIEAVTEPGVAGKMISATAEYFILKGCYLVIATHLGHEIQKNLPKYARIDGIEAKGLSESNELIVNHSPLLGRLAHSTPELIIEKMFKTKGGEYFEFLHGSLNKSVR